MTASDYDPTQDVAQQCRDCGPTSRRILGRGLCSRCYKRRSRAGTLGEVAVTILGVERAQAWLTSMIGVEGCWKWPGGKTNGYGYVRSGGRPVAIHRLSYERLRGPIPDGLYIDHQCHNNDESCAGGDACPHRACANPAHMEAVENGVNVARGHSITSRNRQKTACHRGHALTGDNLIRVPGGRQCRECRRLRGRQRYARGKSA